MTQSCTWSRLSEPELVLLAELLALRARPGLVIALSGDLGAGKTTFARAFIRACAADRALEVPSPTFAIAQVYETARLPIVHYDWYRLQSPDELEEIGVAEAQETSAVLVEWWERCPTALPADRLEITLSETASDPDGRAVALTASGNCEPLVAGLSAVWDVLMNGAPVFGAVEHVDYLQGDASARSYARLHASDRSTHILMDSPAAADGPPVRHGKPYSQIAHLAETIEPFLAISETLRNAGLAAPDIRYSAALNGLAVIEDLGDLTFSTIAKSEANITEPWTVALDALVHLRRVAPDTLCAPKSPGSVHRLPPFDRDAFLIEAELLVDWAWPALRGGTAGADTRSDFVDLWSDAYAQLQALPAFERNGWVLRDYHSPNLIWLADREAIARVGVIDFQDAMTGPWAYDVVSLLQDARTDLPASLEADLLQRYVAAIALEVPDFDPSAFAGAYAILGAQRATKIIGIFHRLAKRDGKAGYLTHLPRLRRYLVENLRAPALSQLANWYQTHLPECLDGTAATA